MWVDINMYVIRIGRLLDEKNLIDQIPSNFHSLVELSGVQSAVEIMLKCIFGRELCGQ